MSSIQIPNLPAVASLSGAELLEAVQAGSSVKVSLNQIAALFQIGTPFTFPLQVDIGGTGTTTSTGTGSVVLSDSPVLVTPELGTGSFDAGAVATPSITFVGDDNTGLWSPGANIVAVSTDGVERMRVAAGVSVGNTVDPGAGNLSVTGSGTFGSISGPFALGTVSAPSITFTGDLNTGIWSPGANLIAASTDGVERLRLGAGLSVGNTVDPGASNLSVTGVVSHGLGAVGTPSITFIGDLNTGFWSPGAEIIAASTNGSERLRVGAGVSIGNTTDPGANNLSVTGVVSHGLGAVTTPSITFTGDLNTGFWSPGANIIAVSTDGTEDMRFHASGGVSIGNTTDPGATNLSVTGAGSFGLGAVGTPSVTFNGDLNTGMWSPAADTIALSTNGAERMRVAAGVSIGNTTDPGATNLSVTGVVSHGLGTVTAPSITFTGDLSTGLWSPASETVAISTSGSERYRVGPAGQLGIAGANYGTSGQAFISGGPSAATSWGTLGLAGGGTGVTTAPAAAAVLFGYTSTATTAGATNLDNTSSQYQLFTGTLTQTVRLPTTSTLTTGWSFHIVNASTGNLTVNATGSSFVGTVIPGTTAMITCISTSVSDNTAWDFGITDFNTLTGTGSVVMSDGATASFALGAVATPSITFTGDLNTGLWSPAADTVAVSTNGTERFRIDSAGVITQPNATSGSGTIVGEQTFRLTADVTAFGPAIGDFFGSTSAISLEASSVYEVTIYAVFTKTTAGTATFTLTASSAPTRMVGSYQGSPVTGIAAGADTSGFAGSQGATTAAFAATGSLSTGVNHAYQFRVQLQTNAATNFRLQLTQGAGTATPLAGSYYTVKKISATTGTFV